MPTLLFNPLKSLDKYFLTCKVVTLLVCLPWPLTLVATVMSLAGEVRSGTPMFEVILIRLAWLLVLVYPVVFFSILFVAEKVLARLNYPLAAVVALLPAGFSVFAVVGLFAI